MAAFYGEVQGGRGSARRLGHSHLTTIAASWDGAIRVSLTRDHGQVGYEVHRVPWHGRGKHELLAKGDL